ncbi:helix-hairpin-helix domain-containing protein [Alteromonas sp. 5E99-2]|uniref:ComEA family DNA-binding protein n=1 Tax=Alteromonas sp. 5E99-2 TaxID=2817683 RepID=UPI001A98DC18|nr:ComEA family DNA-binding protein [Alteromonas sp. 5E99-2]MBO1254124.1 helix-hairpin-helix domain-containing protein [Alteromonas sp. 5E99-2]
MKIVNSILFTLILGTASTFAQTAPVSVSNETTAPEASELKVNINNADVSTLVALPGIGQSKAEAIVQYRQENGSFTQIEELKQVKGIGDKLFAKLLTQISIN